MQEELECFTRNEVWSLVERPKDHRINVIGTKWVFKNKQDEDGIVIRNKARKFEMSMMGELKFFLGFQVRQLAKGTFISQEKYVKDMLKKFNMTNASPMKTPMPVKGQLGSCDGEKDVDIKQLIDGCDLIYCELRRCVRERLTPNLAQYVQLLINRVVPAPLNTQGERVRMAAFRVPAQGDRPEVAAMRPSERRSKERHDHASSSYSRRPQHGVSRFFSSLWQMCKNTNDVAHQSLSLNQETRRRQNEFMATRNAPVPPPGPELEPVHAPNWEMPLLSDEMFQNFDPSLYFGGPPPRPARAPTADADDEEDEGDEDDNGEDDDEEADDEDGDGSSPSTGHEFY
ncbi:hypothetical protein QYE76_066055 [Lolium multiflorum]|uniref:Reverse transcriptase Ty1/copia-type domain-containing protein n=1 Tax=Lolium multiflorum TaxID=4521 RepID=A0AAD8SAC5_LOLMU|nr:hypothetical protein QYE76_066055 [Lolium multiflorum]